MKIYGKSKPVHFQGVVYDDDGEVLMECSHDHLTRSSAEKCARTLAEYLRRKERSADGKR